jgi:predicted RNA polymerase sigma factor
VSTADSTTTIETVFRLEFGRLVAGLSRYVGDVGLGEELAQDERNLSVQRAKETAARA